MFTHIKRIRVHDCSCVCFADVLHNVIAFAEMTCSEKLVDVAFIIVRLALLLGLLYFFICSLSFLSDAFRLLGGKKRFIVSFIWRLCLCFVSCILFLMIYNLECVPFIARDVLSYFICCLVLCAGREINYVRSSTVHNNNCCIFQMLQPNKAMVEWCISTYVSNAFN